MRPDMKKVITERPRSGHLLEYKNFRRSKRGQDASIARSMSKPYGYDKNSPSDVLGPVKNYLKGQVGRPWNDVWSDVCKSNDARSVTGSHLRDHVRWMVHENVFIDENGVWASERRSRLYRDFYVDDNGILCAVPQHPKYKYNKPESKIVRMFGLEYFEYEGIWYEVVTAKLEKKSKWYFDRMFSYWPIDAFCFEVSDYPYGRVQHCNNMYGEAVYCKTKKQVGKRIIKKIKKFLETKNGN